ncbi:MAG TPA: SprT family zinc-dependent metalloprotease [Longimicrobiales bacterium]|nr:SprT family zinc-dependent metalloprotease [Longimicrobiales bacterium]
MHEHKGRTPLHTEETFLGALRARGATRLRKVSFRPTRSTIFSLTRGGAVLNLNAAFRASPPPLLDAFAVIATARSRRSQAYRNAVRRVCEWPPLVEVITEARRAYSAARAAARTAAIRAGIPSAPCCATPEQRAYLRSLYRTLNRERFGGRLPENLPIRLSNRMRRRLGQVRFDVIDGERVVVDIALNVDLMLEANDAQRLDTLLHEMAHAEAYLFHGDRGHGAHWKRIARRVGCEPRACTHARVERRRRGERAVTRVPA